MFFLKNLLSGFQLSLFDNDVECGEPTVKADKKYSIVLSGNMIEYRVVRVRRRSIGMVIGDDGLSVRVSSRVTLHEIEQVLHEKSNWLLKHLNRREQRLLHPKASFVPNLNLKDGDSLTILGRLIVVRWVDIKDFNAEIFWLNNQSDLVLPDTLKEPREPILQQALCDVFMVFLLSRLEFYRTQYGLNCRQIKLSRARTLWGTCRADGIIRINQRLVFLDSELADYVLAHELAHTVYMNHGTQFWGLVEKICPNYKLLSKRLKSYNLRGSSF